MLVNKQLICCIMSAAGAAATSLANLFVASYAGNVTTVSLRRDSNGYSLKPIAVNNECGPSPSWLTLNSKSRSLYCLDEGLDVPNGSLTSYTIRNDGSLHATQRSLVISGPVSGAFYNQGNSLALAHYSGSAVSSWSISQSSPGRFNNLQNLLYTLSKPGPNPDRQDAPHEHEAIVDPTGRYVIVPDLGADLIRVFAFDNAGKLLPKTPYSVVPGSGPRHGAFFQPIPAPHYTAQPDTIEKRKTYMYIVTELGNTITSYEVTYLPNDGGLKFKEIYTSPTYGHLPMPAGNAASEVAVSPDGRFLVIANRNNTSFQVNNPDPKNSTKIPSDSLSTFAINSDGTLSFKQLAPAGGFYPRQFAMNNVGDLVAVGLQMSSAVSLLKRDLKSGLIGEEVARVPIAGQVTCVRWDEVTKDGTNANYP